MDFYYTNIDEQPIGFKYNKDKDCCEYLILVHDSNHTQFAVVFDVLGYLPIEVKIKKYNFKPVIDFNAFNKYLMDTYSIDLADSYVSSGNILIDGEPFPYIKSIEMEKDKKWFNLLQRKIKIKELKKH
jgi:hypothetical protein